MFFNSRPFRQKQPKRNETKPCFLFTLRHRYPNASHAAGIPLSNFAAAMDHTTKVDHQSYERYIPDGTVVLYAKLNERVT